MYGLSRDEARTRTDALLEALELADEGKKPISAFSAGMRKRVAFAAAVIHGPDLCFSTSRSNRSIPPGSRS